MVVVVVRAALMEAVVLVVILVLQPILAALAIAMGTTSPSVSSVAVPP